MPKPENAYRAGSAVAIFDKSGRVLLVRHTYGRRNWELPGGGAEPDEAPDETARREVREETGLAIDLEALTGVYFEPDHEFGPFLHFVFRGNPIDGAAPTPSSPEIGAVGFYQLEDLPRPISDFTERRIREARGRPGPIVARVPPRTWRT